MPARKLQAYPRISALVSAVPRSADSFVKMTPDELRTLEADLLDQQTFDNCLALLKDIARPRRPGPKTSLAAAAQRIGLSKPS